VSDAPAPNIEDMASLDLGPSGLGRQPKPPPGGFPEGFDASYDFTTLWYDAMAMPGGVRLVAPSLLNLAAPVRAARFRIGGAPARLARIRRHRRHDVIELTGPPGAEVEIDLGDWTGRSAVRADRNALFAGLNTAVTLQKDNDPRWIADWVRWHQREHGLQAVLIFDNGSADGAGPVAEALAPLGLARAVVVRAPQPYGGLMRGGGGKFLQSALLNLARLGYLARARAVLQVDVDELVWPGGGPIFDRAVASRLGFVPFRGLWMSPAPAAEAPYLHASHSHRVPGEKPCPAKYCVVPGGWMGGFSWEVHNLENAPPARWLAPKDLGYWHCRAITTDWKNERSAVAPDGEPDPAAAAALAQGLGG
jgi:hypothetical protein